MSRRRRMLAGALLGFVGLAALGVVCHRPILTLIARALLVEDRPARSDAVVVLAGATPEREAKAAALFREGWAPRIILSKPILPDNVRELLALGVRPLDMQGEARLALEKYGVPADRIVTLGDTVRTTESELDLVHTLARDRGYRRVILVTSAQHTRRVKLIWSRAGPGHPVEGLVVSTSSSEFSVDGWWRRRRAAEAVLHEYLGILVIYLGISHLMR